MNEEYEVRWSNEAIYDIAEIEDYIEIMFGIDRAEKFHEQIDNEGVLIGTRYNLNRGTGIYYRGFLIKKKIIKPSILFYCVDEAKKVVYVLRVLRHERNWQKMLREQSFYTFGD